MSYRQQLELGISFLQGQCTVKRIITTEIFQKIPTIKESIADSTAEETYTRKEIQTHLGFHAGSTTITRSAFVSVRPRPPTWEVKRKIGAPRPSWKSCNSKMLFKLTFHSYEDQYQQQQATHINNLQSITGFSCAINPREFITIGYERFLNTKKKQQFV